MTFICPKCGSNSARLEAESDTDLFLRCFCGYAKLMATTLDDGIVIEHFEIEDEITLPKQGSKLMQCLGVIASKGEVSTQGVTEVLVRRSGTEAWSSNLVASTITALKHKGLVTSRNQKRKGSTGSLWELTSEAKALLNL